MIKFSKLAGGTPLPPRPQLRHILWSWAGAALAIGFVAFLSTASGKPWLTAPFGASAVLVFGLPDSPLAQPRNVVGGHVLTTIVGLSFLHLFGTEWWSLALAVATAVALMQATRTVHPPAGANPLVVMLSAAPWGFVLTPALAGSLAIVAIAVIWNNLAPQRRYPLYWIGSRTTAR
ncbi:MAG: HPP family protein [Magnetospirillum sp.]|nr:HPP family protein [Magnetospirillum sp.]